MSDAPNLLAVLTALPDKDCAVAVARTLVTERLAACANLLPGATSLYWWQGKVEQTDECLVVFKTLRGTCPALESRLRELHPYEVPEIVALPAERADPAYAAWVTDSLAGQE